MFASRLLLMFCSILVLEQTIFKRKFVKGKIEILLHQRLSYGVTDYNENNDDDDDGVDDVR